MAARAGNATPASCAARVSRRPGLKIAELFYSLQGEGSLVGVPSVFIRTSGYNLRCAWCDTPYTSWKPEGADLTLSQILAEAAAHPARHVVITGGEPMIAPEIIALTGSLRARGLHITIETAGTAFKPMARYEYQLKFVMRTLADLEEVHSVIEQLHPDRGRVALMPEGTEREALRER